MEGLIYFVRKEFQCKRGVLDVDKVLKLIDTDEARWLLSKPTFEEDTPISNYYRWVIFNDVSALDRATASEFLPAMAESFSTVERAANAGNLDALYRTRNDFDTLYFLAKKGHPRSMSDIIIGHLHLLSPAEYAMFIGRHILLSGDKITIRIFDHSITQQFWFGREMSLYPCYWMDGHFPRQCHMDYIRTYEIIADRARCAALQVLAALKPFLGRDVATMIGKMVYKTRETDCEVWTIDPISRIQLS